MQNALIKRRLLKWNVYGNAACEGGEGQNLTALQLYLQETGRKKGNGGDEK